MRVLGPNCQGVMHVPRRTVASFSNAAAALDPSQVGPVAYVGQSGAVGGAMFDLAARARIDTGRLGEHRQPGRHRRHRGGELPAPRPRGRHDPALCRTDARRRRRGTRSSRAASGRREADWWRCIRGATAAGRRAVTSHTGALVGERRAFELTSEANGDPVGRRPGTDDRHRARRVTVARTGPVGGWRSSARREEPEASRPTGASAAGSRCRRCRRRRERQSRSCFRPLRRA